MKKLLDLAFSVTCVLMCSVLISSCDYKELDLLEENKMDKSVDFEKDKSVIASMGFDISDIRIVDDSCYLVEGDILISPENIREATALVKTRQYKNMQNSLLNAEKQRVIIINTSQVYQYYQAISNAIQQWNAVTGCNLYFEFGLNGDITIIEEQFYTETFANDNSTLLKAAIPANGSPGSTIKINTGCTYRPSSTSNQATYMIMHAIGHAVGLEHTATAGAIPEGLNIPGTPVYDAQSIMIKEKNPLNWNGFSVYDKDAFRILYPAEIAITKTPNDATLVINKNYTFTAKSNSPTTNDQFRFTVKLSGVDQTFTTIDKKNISIRFSQPGTYTITAEFSNNDIYQEIKQEISFTVKSDNPEIIIKGNTYLQAGRLGYGIGGVNVCISSSAYGAGEVYYNGNILLNSSINRTFTKEIPKNKTVWLYFKHPSITGTDAGLTRLFGPYQIGTTTQTINIGNIYLGTMPHP